MDIFYQASNDKLSELLIKFIDILHDNDIITLTSGIKRVAKTNPDFSVQFKMNVNNTCFESLQFTFNKDGIVSWNVNQPTLVCKDHDLHKTLYKREDVQELLKNEVITWIKLI
jgi:hypothetical protein